MLSNIPHDTQKLTLVHHLEKCLGDSSVKDVKFVSPSVALATFMNTHCKYAVQLFKPMHRASLGIQWNLPCTTAMPTCFCYSNHYTGTIIVSRNIHARVVQ